MKYIIFLLFIITMTAIVSGLTLDTEYAPKLVGGGVLGLFFIVFPLFSWYRWKDKKLSDYMLTQENLDKMRENQKRKKH
ncbi:MULTISPECIES: hypothetical protein [Bizionia]|uniref:Uncharacterized protein n=1 Tax=Bizionia algoritergicola TaxID=291187 RepID=A0A5D0R461_9FLAO|nr:MULTISPECIES: hypothetical protein [Bizionia]OBX23696.1 hypothetical protein BAA08_03310 [Bizionia sp. APA-3]TYB75418.1 hypothetical protein ES675_04650 [Bizionia algoritergicola]